MKKQQASTKVSHPKPRTNRTAIAAIAESYQLLFNAAPDAILVVDREGIIRLNNPEAERLLSAGVGELRGLPVEKLIPLSARKKHVQLRKSYMGTPQKRPMGIGLSLSAVKLDGHEFPVEISLSPTHGEDGSNNDVIVILRDVSERLQARRTEHDLARSRALTRVSEIVLRERELAKGMQDVADAASAPLAADLFCVFMLNAERDSLTSVAAAGVLGPRINGKSILRSERMLSGQAIASGTPVLIGDALAAEESLCELLREPRVRSLILAPLNDRERGNGLLIAGALEANRFTTEDVAFMEAIANIVSNALQRNSTEEKLLLSQRLDSLGQLTGGVAHDFNNLLTVMSGNLQILGDSKLEDAYAERALATALRATQRGTELTSKLLAFSRRQTLRPEVIDVEKLLLGFRELLARTIGTNVDVVVRVEKRLPTIEADSGQLETALLNLAVNARDAMPSGGRLTLDASFFRASDTDATASDELPPGEYVRISVADTGAGMSRETLARAFEPFFTTKASGKGSGLGLSMVYGFAKQSSGHVSAYSEPSFGTTVNLYLPASNKSSHMKVAKTKQSSNSMRGNETILIVEDDDEVRAIAEQFLQALGYRVFSAADQGSAIATLKANPAIDLLFSDVVLRGGETGPNVAAALQKIKPGLPVLYASGYARSALPLQIAIDSDLSFLRKPYTREALGIAVRDVLDRARDLKLLAKPTRKSAPRKPR